MATGTPAPSQPRRVRKRILIPVVLLVGTLIAFGWLWWRGTVVGGPQADPTTVADGAVTQLWKLDGGRTVVRSAILVDAPPEAVWQVVSDYDSHPKFMPYIAQLSKNKLDDGRIHLTGLAHSRLWGDWPFEIDVTHNETPGQSYLAEWNEKDKTGFAVNRGMWMIHRAGDKTMVIFSKQMEVPGYPNFIVRNILLNRLGAIVTSVRDEVGRRGKQRS